MADTALAIRLQRDIRDLQKEPLEGIDFRLHGEDMRRMCLILSPKEGPFSSVHLHLDIKIPESYPASPPEVKIQTIVPHPNVSKSGSICCDILRPSFVFDFLHYNGGYTPAYLLKYFFLQLLSFFGSENIDQDNDTYYLQSYGAYHLQSYVGSRNISSAVEKFSCSNCGFNHKSSKLYFSGLRSSETNLNLSVQKNVEPCFASSSSSPEEKLMDCHLDKLDVDCCLQIMDKLPDQATKTLSQVHGGMKAIEEMYNVLIRRNLVCFYLRKTFEETILGLGVEIVPFDNSGRRKTAAVAVLDLFSYEAFHEHQVRTGIWGERFTHFLPLAISNDHMNRAEIILIKSLEEIYTAIAKSVNSSSINLGAANVVLGTIPAMMNRMVLDLMKVCGENSNENTAKKASEKAVQGHCLLYHLFYKLAQKYKEVGARVETTVDKFVSQGYFKSKKNTHDLGELLILLLLDRRIEWGKVCKIFLEELLARNVVGACNEYPHLAFLEKPGFVSRKRLEDTFNASEVSLRTAMFQVCFFRMVRSELSEMVEQRYGYPSEEMSSRLFKLVQDVYEVKDWSGFLRVMGYNGASKQARRFHLHVCWMLREAVQLSQKRGYHRLPCSDKVLYALRHAVEPQIGNEIKVHIPPRLNFSPRGSHPLW